MIFLTGNFKIKKNFLIKINKFFLYIQNKILNLQKKYTKKKYKN